MGTKRTDQVKARKDPKGRAKPTLPHRDRTKYTRKEKHRDKADS